MLLKKKDAHPFKVPQNINLIIVDPETGLPPNSSTKSIIYESFKSEDYFADNLEKPANKDRLGLYDSKNSNKILQFY